MQIKKENDKVVGVHTTNGFIESDMNETCQIAVCNSLVFPNPPVSLNCSKCILYP